MFNEPNSEIKLAEWKEGGAIEDIDMALSPGESVEQIDFVLVSDVAIVTSVISGANGVEETRLMVLDDLGFKKPWLDIKSDRGFVLKDKVEVAGANVLIPMGDGGKTEELLVLSKEGRVLSSDDHDIDIKDIRAWWMAKDQIVIAHRPDNKDLKFLVWDIRTDTTKNLEIGGDFKYLRSHDWVKTEDGGLLLLLDWMTKPFEIWELDSETNELRLVKEYSNVEKSSFDYKVGVLLLYFEGFSIQAVTWDGEGKIVELTKHPRPHSFGQFLFPSTSASSTQGHSQIVRLAKIGILDAFLFNVWRGAIDFRADENGSKLALEENRMTGELSITWLSVAKAPGISESLPEIDSVDNAALLIQLIEEWLEIDQQITDSTSEVATVHLGGGVTGAPKKRVKRVSWAQDKPLTVPVKDGDNKSIEFFMGVPGGSASRDDAEKLYYKTTIAGGSLSELWVKKSGANKKSVIKAEEVYQIKAIGDKLIFVVSYGLSEASTELKIAGLEAVFISEEQALTDSQYKGMFDSEPASSTSDVLPGQRGGEAGAVKLAQDPWLKNPVGNQLIHQFSFTGGAIELRQEGNEILINFYQPYKGIKEFQHKMGEVDIGDIVSAGRDNEKDVVVVVLKNGAKSGIAFFDEIRFVSESYALEHPEEFKDILKYEALEQSGQGSAVSGQQSTFAAQAFFDSLQSPLWMETGNILKVPGMEQKTYVGTDRPLSYVPHMRRMDGHWEYLSGAKPDGASLGLTMAMTDWGRDRGIDEIEINYNSKRHNTVSRILLLEIKIDEENHQTVFVFDSRAKPNLEGLDNNYQPPQTWGHRFEFVDAPATTYTYEVSGKHLVGVEGLKTRRDEIGKQIDALMAEALAALEKQLAEKEAELEVAIKTTSSAGEAVRSYEKLPLGLDAGETVESVVTLKGKRFLLSTTNGKGLKIKVWKDDKWDIFWQDSLSADARWEKVGDKLLIEKKDQIAGESKLLLFNGVSMDPILDYGADGSVEWEVIGDEILISQFEKKNATKFHYWDGKTTKPIEANGLPDTDNYSNLYWKMEGDQVLLKINKGGTQQIQFFKWDSKDATKGFVKLTETLIEGDKNWPVFDGKILIATDKNMMVVDIKTGATLNTVPGKLVTLNVNGKRALINYEEKGVSYLTEWDGQNFKPINVDPQDGQIRKIYFSKGKFLVIFSKQGKEFSLKQLKDDGSSKLVDIFLDSGDSGEMVSFPVLVNDSLLVPLQKVDGTYALTKLTDNRLVPLPSDFETKSFESESLTPLGKDQAVAQIFYTDGTTQFLVWDGNKIHRSDIFGEAVSEMIDGKLLIYGKNKPADNFQLVIWDGKEFVPQENGDVNALRIKLRSLHGHLFRLSGPSKNASPQISFWNGNEFEELIPAGVVNLKLIKDLDPSVPDQEQVVGLELSLVATGATGLDPSTIAFLRGFVDGHGKQVFFLNPAQSAGASPVVNQNLISKLQAEITQLKTAIVARSELREVDAVAQRSEERSEKRIASEGTVPSVVLRERGLSPAMVQVAEALGRIFSVETAKKFAASVMAFLRENYPQFFIDEKRVLDIRTFLTPGIMTGKFIVGRVYNKLPRGSEYKFWVTFLAENPLAKFVFSAASVKREAGHDFALQLTKDISEMRKKLGKEVGRVNVTWEDEPVNVVASLAEETKEASEVPGLLFSDQQDVEPVGLGRVLLVENDHTSDEDKTLFGLVASLHELFSPNKKTGIWVKVSYLLKHFSLLAEVRKAFAQSA